MNFLIMNKRNLKYDSLPEITAGVFLRTSLTLFFITLLSTMGSVIDGFIIGHYMETTDVGAISLTSPVWFVAAIIHGILSTGSQPLCTKELGKGNRENARQIFSMTLIVGVSVTFLLSLLMLVFSRQVTGLLGAVPEMDVYDACRRYLTGISPGFPALTAISLLSTGIRLEGEGKWTIRCAAVVTFVNILLDLVVVLLHGGMFMMGLSTSMSYYAGLAVLALYYFRKKEALLRPVICRVSTAVIGSIVLYGLPLGVSRITTTFRSLYINRVLASGASSTGLAAYNVQVQLTYLTNSMFMAMAGTLSTLLCLYFAEENKRGLKYTVRIALAHEVFWGLIITLLLRSWYMMPLISWFYLGRNEEAVVIAQVAIYFFAAGLLGQALSVLFANYLCSIGRIAMANIIYVLCDVVLVVIMVSGSLSRLSPGVSDAVRNGMIFWSISRAQLAMIAVIPVMILLINLLWRNSSASLEDAVLLLPKGYGAAETDQLTASPRTLEEVICFSKKAYDFCIQKQVRRKEAYYVSLAVEEMAANILKHGFKDSGHHTMEVRVICKQDVLYLRIRDNSHIFDPIKKAEAVSDIMDPSRYIGIRMVMTLADEVIYTPTLKLNNLLIRINHPYLESPGQ